MRQIFVCVCDVEDIRFACERGDVVLFRKALLKWFFDLSLEITRRDLLCRDEVFWNLQLE
jgi:hypothetical protein